MTDEMRPDEAGTPPQTPPAEASAPDGAATATAEEEGKPVKLHQTVEIKDVGPCKKHIKVTVDRKDIDDRFGEKFSELVADANVAGFRPGKAPRKIIERRFHKEVGDQVKTEVLLASLEQLAEEHDIAPLSHPDLDPANIEMPKRRAARLRIRGRGPAGVRPAQLQGPQDQARRPHLHRRGGGPGRTPAAGAARPGRAQAGGQRPDRRRHHGRRDHARRRPRRQHHQGGPVPHRQASWPSRTASPEKFAEQVQGAKAGDAKVVDIELSTAVADAGLRGKTVKATFDIKDVKTLRLPELTHEFLHTFGVHHAEQLHELVRVVLERRLEYTQRQSAREQVMEHIRRRVVGAAAKTCWCARPARRWHRRLMEMRADGISEEEIAQRQRLLQQDMLRNTELALKEHFVLQKIAEIEKIDVNEDDLSDEIDRLADQSDESPRRVRARLEKDDLLDALAAEMIERKALDLILDSAEYDDVPLTQEDAPAVATVEEQAVPGEMQRPQHAAAGRNRNRNPGASGKDDRMTG